MPPAAEMNSSKIMELNSVTTIMSTQLDGWCISHSFVDHMDQFKKTSALIGACGHDNRELEIAIAEADKAIENLKSAREQAVARFKAECEATCLQ